MLPHYIQIIPSSPFITHSFLKNIISDIRSSLVSYRLPWKISYQKDRFSEERIPYIFFKKKGYKNMGFLQLIDFEDSINIKFIQPRFSIPTSEKCKAYLFAEFISYLHNRHQNFIIAISVLNFKNIFLNKPSIKDFFLNITIKRCINVKEFSHLLERKILSLESPYKKYGFDKQFSPKIKVGLEYIELLYSPKTSFNPYYKKNFCMLAVLMSDFIQKEFHNYIENIQILNL